MVAIKAEAHEIHQPRSKDNKPDNTVLKQNSNKNNYKSWLQRKPAVYSTAAINQ